MGLCPALTHAGNTRNFVFTPVDADAAFSVRLVWLQSVSGHFRDMRGSVRIDPQTGTARVDARIRVRSVTVHPAHYRQRLLGPHFFNARLYPYIYFMSRPISVADLRHGGHLEGRLTLHGVTRPLTLQLEDNDCPQDSLEGCTLRLKGVLDRTRFDMRAYRALVSRRVHLNLAIRLSAEPDPPSDTAPEANSR